MPRDAPGGERTFWSGTITFGLVSVPVSLISAVRNARPRLRMLDEEGHPLQRRYHCPDHDEFVDADQIVRGYEHEGKMVTLTDRELESLEPQKSRDIDLHRFVEEGSIDPLLFEKPYFLVPEGTSNKAYRLLAQVLEQEKRMGVATFVMREKEYLIAVLSEKGILRAEILRMPDEIRDPEELGLGSRPHSAAADVKHVEAMIKKHTGARLALTELEDTDTGKLLKLIESKRKSGDLVKAEEVDEEVEEQGKIVDLMAVLKRSLAGGTKGAAGKATRPTRATRAPRRKRTTRKPEARRRAHRKKATGGRS